MKLKKYIYGIALGALSLTFASCYNADRDFPDYEGGTTAYFAYQFPVRTLILGNDIYDNTLDNDHKCRIWSTMGGAYGGRDAYVEIAVDETLCDNLYFTDVAGNSAASVLPMPSSYYKLASNVIPYNGDSRGYVEVQFTDEFFADPLSVENTYVIPLVMKNVTGIDHILTGKPREGETPSRTNTDDWEILAKDYVLYCVKYKNPWEGNYIRRGTDKVTDAGVDCTYVRKDTTLVNSDPEHYSSNPVNAYDEVCSISTQNMTQAIFPVSISRNVPKEPSISCNLILTFNGNKCTISSEDPDVEVSGSGEFINKGTEQPEYAEFQWGSNEGELVQRDILRLSYNILFKQGKYLYTIVDEKTQKKTDVFLESDMNSVSEDILVVRDRDSNKKEFFSTKYEIKK